METKMRVCYESCEKLQNNHSQPFCYFPAMTSKAQPEIVIQGARTHNLKDISLRVPHHQLIVVTGVSGSGKSSLVFDVIAQEGQRRYFETLPSFARQFMGKLNRPDVDTLEGLSPVIAIGQQTTRPHARSTVGTLSDLYDLLRLLFARTGTTDRAIKPSRALFSFNSVVGKCRECNGIGKQEEIDLNRLIAFPEKTIRQGALAPTLPTGYIMYSQVTIDVLNQVCEAEGFNVDIPWNELTDAQREVVLFGSDKIKVPFGKHTLESRLKWTGMKAKPREEGYYKGMLPIMSDILRRDRNANILKYVHSVTCLTCNGTRLNSDALSVSVQGKSIAEVSALELSAIKSWMDANRWEGVALEIIQKMATQVAVLEDLGLGHLNLDRASKSLRASEIQRIRVANQILAPLSDILYVFDEPSIGLHRAENQRMIQYFRQLVNKGNTVIVVEHDLETITSADHIIEIGPGAGTQGGEVIFNGPLSDFVQNDGLKDVSPTHRALNTSFAKVDTTSHQESASIRLLGCRARNLKSIDVDFQLGKLNVVSGKSGAGKSSLVNQILVKAVQEQLGIEVDESAQLSGHENLEAIEHLVFVNHSPIGKTPRSNPATYLGLSDHIRDLFASLPESKARGFTKSRFSFNTSAALSAGTSASLSAGTSASPSTSKGGRCETCQGAGKTQIGMHFLGNVDLVCGTCNGDRFNKETLEVTYEGLSIADVYRLSVDEAITFFKGQKKILTGLNILHEIGLGYLTLGQSSTTLSGGEAQRIKIANQLQKKDSGNTLYVLLEPSIGLHQSDIGSLLQLFDRIKQNGNTIVCIEQNETIIAQSDWYIELGPESGALGGSLVYQGVPKTRKAELAINTDKPDQDQRVSHQIELKGVTTHGLKHIDVTIHKNQLTVVTGLSGSGKTSLVYDTLFSESNARFTESLSAYNRSFLQQNSEAEIAAFSGLGPAIGINRKGSGGSKRSTVGTLSGVYDAFRLLYSRIAQQEGKTYTAQHFSFNHHLGACPTCEGLGAVLTCDPDEVIIAPEQSIWEGAVSTNKALAYYADPNGQFMATLKTAVKEYGWDLERPWQQLEEEIRQVVLYGTGERVWDVTWEFTTKSRTGVQELRAQWLGLCNYVDDEYQRRLHNKNISHLEALLHAITCPTCDGSRLKPELLTTKFLGKDIHALSKVNIGSCLQLLEQVEAQIDSVVFAITEVVLPSAKETLQTLVDLGLDYLNLDRPVNTLSGGERQRVTLAGQLSTHLFGVTYVLDEPTIGLDGQQVKVLSQVLRKIVANGNTVVAVEHDPSFIQTADYLIEMGPGAGRMGGEVIFQGPIEDLKRAKQSITYQMLNQEQNAPVPRVREKGVPFGLKGAVANNLKQIDVDFHAGQLIAVTGVSGSGKSSLVKEVLYRSWVKKRAVNCSSVFGLEQFEQVLLMDQEPMSQNRLSTPISYTGIIEPLKTLFSKTEQAKKTGLKRADFSYQSKNGKCPVCAGHGQLKTSMDFMSDIWLTCDRCNGMRYSDAVLACKYQGRSIGHVLCMTVQEAIEFFGSDNIVENLKVLQHVGLGHLVLGQSGNTLSGGEAQRLKLAQSLLQKRKGNTLYLFDEPSTGLHYFDILRLIEVFQSMVDRGDTVLFIEHHTTLVEAANQVVKLGPRSGDNGGALMS